MLRSVFGSTRRKLLGLNDDDPHGMPSALDVYQLGCTQKGFMRQPLPYAFSTQILVCDALGTASEQSHNIEVPVNSVRSLDQGRRASLQLHLMSSPPSLGLP